jgi:anti-sigma B factor antagonist
MLGEGTPAHPRGMQTLKILAVASAGCRTLVLSGELDLSSTDEFEAMVGQVFGPDTELLKIDLRRLTFMDCAGLHVLVGASELCARNGCEFEVVAGPAAARVLEISGLGDVAWLERSAEAIG